MNITENTRKKANELANKYNLKGSNLLQKIDILNKRIKKGKPRTPEYEEIYNIKDAILLDDIISSCTIIFDLWDNTGHTLEEDWFTAERHLGIKVRKILRKKGLLVIKPKKNT